MSDDTPDPEDLSIPSSVDSGEYVPKEDLRALRDECDKAAENALDSDESAYEAYERIAGRLEELL